MSGGETLPLLFEWEELENMAERACTAAAAADHLLATPPAPHSSREDAAETLVAPVDGLLPVEFEPELRLVVEQQVWLGF